jgi:hypothetical protein
MIFNLSLIRWSSSTGTTVIPISQTTGDPDPDHQLLTGKDEVLFEIFKKGMTTYIARTDDGGGTWDTDFFINDGYGNIVRQRVATDGENVLGIVHLRNDSASNKTLLIYWIVVFSEGSARISGGSITTGRIPLFNQAFTMQYSGGHLIAIWLECEGNITTTEGDVIRHMVVKCVACKPQGGESKQIDILRFDTQAPETSSETRNHPQIMMRMEKEGAPIIAVSIPNGDRSRHSFSVWQFNHPPSIPTNVTKAGGGWLLGSFVVLQVQPSYDPDGDRIEYRFKYTDDNTTYMTEFGPRPFTTSAVIDHGIHKWSVEARDVYNGSSGWSEGWSFRLDKGPPVADAGGYYFTEEGKWITLDGSGSFDDGFITTWEWDIDDDGVFELSTNSSRTLLKATDDYTGFIHLRVTDEYGWQSIASAPMVIMNVNPVVEIDGPMIVLDQASYRVWIHDPSESDNVTVRWFLDGRIAGYGNYYNFTPVSLHRHFIVAYATDDDGGFGYDILEVDASTSERPFMEIIGPQQVIEGQKYHVEVVDIELGLYNSSAITWRMNGSLIGAGPSIEFRAGHPSTVFIEVGVMDAGNFIRCNTTTIVVISHIQPVSDIGIVIDTYYSVIVHWRNPRRIPTFQKYIVRVSSSSLPVLPSDDLDWMHGSGNEQSLYVEILVQSQSSVLIDGLQPGHAYVFNVYTISDEEVVSSQSVVASIPNDTMDSQPPPTGSNGGVDVPYVGLLITMVLLISAISIVSIAILISNRSTR